MASRAASIEWVTMCLPSSRRRGSVGHAERHLVAQLRRPEGVGVDEASGIGLTYLECDPWKRAPGRSKLVDCRHQEPGSSCLPEPTFRRPPSSRARHRRHGRGLRPAVELMDDYDLAGLHVLSRRARSPPVLQRCQRPHTRVRRASNGRLIRSCASTSTSHRSRRRAAASTPPARRIKLHPRAQSSRRPTRRLGPVFELAAERRILILIHAGRGLPRLRRASAASSSAIRREASSSPMPGSRMHGTRGVHARSQGRLLRHLDLSPRPARLLRSCRSKWCTPATTCMDSSRRRCC